MLPISGPSCSRFIPEEQRHTGVLTGLGVTFTWSERAFRPRGRGQWLTKRKGFHLHNMKTLMA
ncbi:MAG: hypothetical protein ABSD11_19490, partial [Methylocella sp.]